LTQLRPCRCWRSTATPKPAAAPPASPCAWPSSPHLSRRCRSTLLRCRRRQRVRGDSRGAAAANSAATRVRTNYDTGMAAERIAAREYPFAKRQQTRDTVFGEPPDRHTGRLDGHRVKAGRVHKRGADQEEIEKDGPYGRPNSGVTKVHWIFIRAPRRTSGPSRAVTAALLKAHISFEVWGSGDCGMEWLPAAFGAPQVHPLRGCERAGSHSIPQSPLPPNLKGNMSL